MDGTAQGEARPGGWAVDHQEPVGRKLHVIVGTSSSVAACAVPPAKGLNFKTSLVAFEFGREFFTATGAGEKGKAS